MNPTIDFALQLRSFVERALEELDVDTRRDVYAVSFFVYDECDDPRRPTISISVNTNSHWRKSFHHDSESTEARWNYDYWPQEHLAVFGDSDDESAAVVREWIVARGLWFSDDEVSDDSRSIQHIERFQAITTAFVEVACRVVTELHDQGAVVRLFGRPVPILVHEIEFYDEIANQTERCNPPGLAAEFADWVRSLGNSGD
jgi:hypothetical protein